MTMPYISAFSSVFHLPFRGMFSFRLRGVGDAVVEVLGCLYCTIHLYGLPIIWSTCSRVRSTQLKQSLKSVQFK